MPEKTLFEYAVVRLVPRVEREEFINIGVILYCRKHRFAGVRYMLDRSRIALLCADVDIDLIEYHLKSFENICLGVKDGGRLAQLEVAERFRWLTAKRSTIIQCSPVHPGLCESADDMLQILFEQLVL